MSLADRRPTHIHSSNISPNITFWKYSQQSRGKVSKWNKNFLAKLNAMQMLNLWIDFLDKTGFSTSNPFYSLFIILELSIDRSCQNLLQIF